MTAQLSREIVENLLQHNDESDSPANAEAWEVNALCRLALAGLDNKPVAWIVHARQGDMLTSDGDFVANAEGINGIRSTPLYTVPPAPVTLTVSKDEIRKIFIRNGFTIKDGQSDLKDYVYDAAFELISSLKLPAPVAVPDEIQPTSGSSDFEDYYCDGWNACRAAMLKAGPVTGWIKCSERMPGEHEEVWVVSRNGTMAYGVEWLGDAWFWDDMTHSQEEWGVTHWMPMPLPAAPEQEDL